MPGVDKGGNVRNLGYVSTETIANLKDFVFKGPFRDQGMPDFTGKLNEEDVVKIQAFIQGTADAIRPKSNNCHSGRCEARTRNTAKTEGLRETIAQPFVVLRKRDSATRSACSVLSRDSRPGGSPDKNAHVKLAGVAGPGGEWRGI